jgi:hypothetical protein
LDNVACNSRVVLDRLSRDGLETRDLCIERRLVAPESSEDLLPCDCVRFVDGVVRTVSRAIVAVKAESTATAEIALGNSACNEVLLDDSGRAEQCTNRSSTSTSTDLRGLASIRCGEGERDLRL